MTKRKVRVPVITLWATHNRRKGTLKDPVSRILKSAIRKTNQALKSGEFDGTRISMLESGNISVSIVRATTTINLYLKNHSDDIKILHLLKETGFSLNTFIKFGVHTVRDLLNVKAATLKKIIKHFKTHDMKLPLLVRMMIEEALASKEKNL